MDDMYWPSAIMGLLGTTSLAGIVSSIVYYRENRRLKKNEVALSDVDTQRQQMELAEMYKDKMLQLLEQMNEKQDSGNNNQTRILNKLDTLDSRVDGMDSRMGDIVAYLNGGFQDFLKHQHPKQYNKPRQRRKPETDNK